MRPLKAAGLSAVMLSLMVALLIPAVAEARLPFGQVPVAPPGRSWTPDAAVLARTAPQAVKHGTTNKSCTGWRSTLMPPPSIRVLRTLGPDAGHVETVDFHTYVLTVFGAEWQGFYPLEALKVGSIAVKQYGWYYTIVYRGGVDATGECYDVQDNTKDQYYQPELRTPLPIHTQALAATWNITLRKYEPAQKKSLFFLTGYRQGTGSVCAADRDGWHLYEHSVFGCAKKSKMDYEQILRAYFDPKLEIVDPGAHDIIGTGAGDASVLIPGDTTDMTPRLYQPVAPTGLTPAGTSSLAVGDAGFLGARSADITNDGYDDLVTLTATSATGLRLAVAASDGTSDYLDFATYWNGDIGRPVAGARLLTGDFTADGMRDAAVLVQDPPPAPDPNAPPPPPTATLLLFRQNATGTAFTKPIIWWTGQLDLSNAQAWAADVNGDGRSDLVVEQSLGDAGVSFSSAVSTAPTAGLGALVDRVDAPDLTMAKTLVAIGDVNRDGRDDIFVAYPQPGGTRVDILRAKASGIGFVRATAWTSTKANAMPFGKVKIASADVNYDGMSDLVLFVDGGAKGTTLATLRANYGTLTLGSTVVDPTLDWSTADPY